MIKQNWGFKRSVVIKPENSFIHQIQIDGDNVTVQMSSSPTQYHYVLDKHLIKELIGCAKNKQSIGRFYNKYLRGTSISKTLYV